MSIFIDPKAFCNTCNTTAKAETSGEERLRNSLITIIILILVIYLLGGRVFGGYGSYPGFGGFSLYGYTLKPKRYRYFDDYIVNYEPDF